MIYVVIGILVLLAIAGGITVLVTASTKDAAPFAGPDHTPAGDTAQHAGEQDEAGQTVKPSDQQHSPTGPRTEGGGRYKRDPVGGEGEGETTVPAEVPHPHRS
jgi:hypothetical protein